MISCLFELEGALVEHGEALEGCRVATMQVSSAGAAALRKPYKLVRSEEVRVQHAETSRSGQECTGIPLELE